MVLTPVSYFHSYSSANSRVTLKCVALLLVLAAGTLVNSVYAQEPESGDVVLLAPACASFDQFENFEHRGRVFKQLVAELI